MKRFVARENTAYCTWTLGRGSCGPAVSARAESARRLAIMGAMSPRVFSRCSPRRCSWLPLPSALSGGYIFSRAAPWLSSSPWSPRLAGSCVARNACRRLVVALVALAAFTVWTGLSVLWSVGPDLSWRVFGVMALCLGIAWFAAVGPVGLQPRRRLRLRGRGGSGGGTRFSARSCPTSSLTRTRTLGSASPSATGTCSP
jgi:hypothetical protein